MNPDLGKINRLDRRDIAASKAQDYSALLELWDDEGVAIPPGEEPIAGIDAIEKWLSQAGDTEYEITKYEHDFKERRIIGDWAFEWGTYASAAIPLEGGDPLESSGKLLRILRRQQDGEWKVARAIWNIDPNDE
jgi:uncharacterized protein (TIGR02246 family)